MRVGVSEQSARKPGDPRAGARFMVERAAAARRAGLDSLFVGDHHATPAPYYQNVPIIARMLAEWGDRPAGCLFLLPLWNPVLRGRAGRHAGGHRGRALHHAGGPRRRRGPVRRDGRDRAHARVGLRAVARRRAAACWPARSSAPSGRYTFREARLALRPAEPVDVWIGASAAAGDRPRGPPGRRLPGRPGRHPAQARAQITHYLERCAAYGRTPRAVAVRRDIYVADSPADAETVAGPIRTGGYRGFDPSALVIGTVDEVTASFRALGAMGYTDVIVRHVVDDQPRVLDSLARLADVRKHLA